MLNLKKILISFFVLFFVQISQSAKIGSKDIQWSVYNTKHFSIIYNRQQQDLSLYYGKIAEQAYSNLGTVFKILPEKIALVLNDSTDSSNGNATVFPYPLINVYTVQIGPQETLSESSEWARELVTHELTHIAQLYPYKGMHYKILRGLFGSIISPNLMTPNWWKEGMAVELETEFSNKGRTRSLMQDAQVRAFVLSNTFKNYDIAQANEHLITWPFGNRPYFFGSLLMNQISLEKGPQGIGEIVDRQSTMPPYFINSTAEKVTQFDYNDLYEKMLNRYQKNAEEQISNLQKIKMTQPEFINSDLIQSRWIKYNPTHQIVGQISTTQTKTQIEFYKFNPSVNKWTLLELDQLPSGSLGGFSFHPTEKKIVFSKVRHVNSRENFSDLFIYDLQDQKITDLTSNERAREPLYSPSGKFVLFTQIKNGQTSLQKIDVATQKIQNIITFSFENRLNSYAFATEDDILYTVRNLKGRQQLFFKQKDKEPVLIQQAPDDIRFINYKNSKLYFNSGKNGVTNIYQAQIKENQLTEIKPISHFITGALSFDVDSQNSQLYATLITDKGLSTATSSYLATNELPQIENKNLQHYKPYVDQPFETPPMNQSTLTDYSSWSYLYPRYWIPFISTNNTGDGVLFQALTSAGDPLGNHAYALQANYDTTSKKLGYIFNYLNSQFFWDWSLSASETQQLITIDNYVRRNNLSFAISPDIFSISEDLTMSLGSTLSKTEDDLTKFQTEHWGGFLQTLYSTIDLKSHQYYPMTGLSLGIKYQYFTDLKKQTNPKYGNYSQALFSMATYQNLFLPKDHSLVLKLNGLYTFEDVAQRFGTSNLSLPGESDLLNPFVIRGYQAAQFLGTQLFTSNLEYRFPVMDIMSGNGTVPFYIKYLTGAVVADALATKGFGYNKNEVYEALDLNEPVYSAGAEARLSTTVGYLLPVQFIFGVYAPFDKKWSKDSVVTGLNIQISGF